MSVKANLRISIKGDSKNGRNTGNESKRVRLIRNNRKSKKGRDKISSSVRTTGN